MAGKQGKRGKPSTSAKGDAKRQDEASEKKSPERPVRESEVKAFKQQVNIAKENEAEDSDEQGDYFVESDLESEYIQQGQDFEKWSEGLADEQNYDAAPERQMTELEPLHVVPARGEDIVEIEDSDSVIGSQSYVDSDEALIDEKLVDAHECQNESCTCNVLEGDFCAGSCKTGDPSEDEAHCACGHVACNATQELSELGGLEATA